MLELSAVPPPKRNGEADPPKELSYWRKMERWHTSLAVSSIVYFVYRSQGSPTFTKYPFEVKPNDMFGLFFIFMFLLTKKATHLIFAINPARNVFMVLLQSIFRRLDISGETTEEYIRDVISAAFQLTLAYSIRRFCVLRKIGKNTGWEHRVPYASAHLNKTADKIISFILCASAIVLVVLSLKKHTENFTSLGQPYHGFKVALAVLLGISEEVTWREACLDDSNNAAQSFIWGMNHLVVGEGMDNPFVYGFVSLVYAFALGVCKTRWMRYLHHASIEYFIMDNLISPT